MTARKNVLKLFYIITYKCFHYLECLSLASLPSLGLMFVRKARNLPRSRAVLHSGRLQPYMQTLDEAGKAWKGQTLELITKFVNYGGKKCYNIRPRM